MKIILDTDIGSDIDDAVCLAYLLAQPACELLGVTTVTGEAEKRARMISALCKVARKEVPIMCGTEQPLLVAAKQPTAPQAARLEQWPHDMNFPKNAAVEFLRQTIRAHPGDITLLTIGPLTNIGLLFAIDPEIPSLLKGLVMMGGAFDKPVEGSWEWNILLDPHAAEIVYRARPAMHRSVGSDITFQVQMPANEVRERFSQIPLLRPVLDFAEVWFEDNELMTFHDPLAAATLFDNAICEFAAGTVTVAWDDESGRTFFNPGSDDKPHEVAVGVDAKRFVTHYFSVFEGG